MALKLLKLLSCLDWLHCKICINHNFVYKRGNFVYHKITIPSKSTKRFKIRTRFEIIPLLTIPSLIYTWTGGGMVGMVLAARGKC